MCGEQPSSEMAKGEETVIAVEISNEALRFLSWPSAESKMCLCFNACCLMAVFVHIGCHIGVHQTEIH